MSKKHCMFQYYTSYTYMETRKHEDTGLITWEEAVKLWNEYKDQVVEEIEDEISEPEMCIWTGCENESDYRTDSFHVDKNTATENGELVEITVKVIDPSSVTMGEPELLTNQKESKEG